MTFWNHLDALRSCIIKAIVVVVVFGVLAFIMKEELFNIVLAPRSSDFITYKLLGGEPFSLHLMNTGLTEQFVIHMKTAMYAGLLAASPYVLYLIFGFIAPALYNTEKRYVAQATISAYFMFIIGTLVNYFIVFPLAVRFLGTYQVSEDVQNMLTLQSYIETLLSMTFVMGVIFELPVVSWVLARIGILKHNLMTDYRRHAIVAIFIIAAIITPTGDIFTLLIVSLPIWLLYETSILVVKRSEKK
ncbi:MAG: twin-arginine translocase subunit TatC [Prevotella sp.]|nr:twin-arginine translocase subunit TatC [Prevotella sp.]